MKNFGSKEYKDGPNVDQRDESMQELLRRLGLIISRDRPELYIKAMKRLVLY